MSVQATTWVWSNSKTTGTAKLVMLAIADHAWQDGTNAWPSIGRLAKMTGLSEMTVRRGVATAESLGELRVVRSLGGRSSKGTHASNDYVLVMEQPSQDDTPDLSQPSQGDTPNPLKTIPLGVSGLEGNRNRTVKVKEPKPSANEADGICRNWWESTNPKPLIPFIAAKKIIEKAIRAGWSGDQVAAALPKVETLAGWSLEKVLKQEKSLEKSPDKSWWG